MIKGENEKLLYEILNEVYPGQWVSEHKGIEGSKFLFENGRKRENKQSKK